MYYIVAFVIVILVSVSLALFGSKWSTGLTPKSMYNIASCLVVASIIAGLLSFSAIYIALKSPNTDLYENDVAVEVLGVLVTILMGWNIVSVVDFKQKMEKVDVIYNDFEHVISGIMQLYINSFLIRGDKDTVFDNCMIALDEIVLCKNSELNKRSINDIMDLLNRLCETMKKTNKCIIYKGSRLKYLHILRHIDHEYSESVIDFVNTAEETGRPEKKKNFKFNSDLKGEIKVEI